MPRRFLVVVWLMGGGWGYPAAHPSGDKELEGNMARLILNCEGVGLVMRELGRDICYDWPGSIEPDSH